MSEADCIFCKIVRGEIDAEVVHDEDDVLAFEDINGKAPVHVLVIPRQHVANLEEIGELARRGGQAPLRGVERGGREARRHGERLRRQGQQRSRRRAGGLPPPPARHGRQEAGDAVSIARADTGRHQGRHEAARQDPRRRAADARRRAQERRDRGGKAAHRTGRADHPQAPAQAARRVGRGVPQGRPRGAGRIRVGRGRDRPRLPPPAPLARGAEEDSRHGHRARPAPRA